MDYIYLSVIGSLIGTGSIVLVYIYLYALYRERHIGIWALSWLILLSRYVLFDAGIFDWKQSIVGLTTYQILILISIMLFVWGTYIFADKPFNRWWLYSTAGILILTITLNTLFSHLLYTLLIPIFFGSFVCIWIGITFIKHFKLKGIGRFLNGYAYILWGLLNLLMPFTINIPWLAPWGYSIGGLLRMAIAVGTLMVYFEKTRSDLIQKETQYRILAENAVDIIYYFRLSPKVTLEYISPSVFTVTGHKAEEYYANSNLIFSLIHPDDIQLMKDFINNISEPSDLPLTLRLLRKDTTTVWIEQKSVPIYDETGKLVALEGIIRDITVRKSLEQMASMFDRMNMIGSMAATVAHEIRNPMTTVRGYLQVLQRRKVYQDDREKFSLMIEEIDRADSIIREYLSLSREKFANFKKCSLNYIIESLFPLIQANANSAKVFVNLNLTDIPELLLDENEIRQLLLNLVRNGIEAMPSGGTLAISTFLENNMAVMTISDQGTGIPAHVLDNIGTPFITTKETGTGLGLPICYQIAHRHKASIRIDTSSEGTTFLIYFKLLPNSAPSTF